MPARRAKAAAGVSQQMPRAAQHPQPHSYHRAVAILIDVPRWPAHGRLWSHLVSDSSIEELHAFARRNDIPRRAFDLDHYDVPDDAHARLVAAGATPVDGRELVRRLIASGLRVTARERRRSPE